MPKRRKNEDDDSVNGRTTTQSHPYDVSIKEEEHGSGNTSAIPIFLKKTYRMIETCDSEVCSWTSDGEMFVVKNPELFASDIIPQYFDHNKFSSFARQLNFYGFRKIQTKPIRNEDYDKSTAKHVTFFNEKFKRDRYDLLKDIQRSTRGGGSASLADQAREVDTMRSTVVALESRVQELEASHKDLSMKMAREIQAKVEMSMMGLLSRQHQPHPQSSLQAIQAAQYMGMPSHPIMPTSSGETAAILQRAERSFGSAGRNPQNHGGWGNPLLGPQAARAFSIASSQGGGVNAESSATSGNGATLPPHPKQKSLPPPAGGGIPQTTSRGMDGGSGGLRSMPTAGNPSLLLRNAWEDKFYSTLMMNEGTSRAASLAGLANGMGPSGIGMGGGNVSGLAALAAAQQMQNQNNNAGYAAYMQDRVQRQRGASAGRNNGGAEPVSNKGPSSLERQTTAEILLEAAGELGKNSQGKGGK